MSELGTSPHPITLETEQSDLMLVQMVTAEDDRLYLELQNSNTDFWREFGNALDESTEAATARRLEHGNNRYGIWAGDKLVGIVGYSIKQDPAAAEIGVLLDEAATGHGYATSAIKALTDYAKHRFNRVYAEVEPTNENSIGLLNRAGYVSSGETVTREWGEALVFEAPR